MSKDKITVNMNIYDIPILVEELEKANKEIERLSTELNTCMIERNNYLSKIDKATEYIKEYLYINEETGEYCLTHTFDKCNLYELLKILDKGE